MGTVGDPIRTTGMPVKVTLVTTVAETILGITSCASNEAVDHDHIGSRRG